MLITKQIEIDAGHRVPNHKSKCRNLHGHRYKIEVGIDDKLISTPGHTSEGMVIDFSDVKECLMQVIDSKYDHSFIVFGEDPLFKVLEKFCSKEKLKLNVVPFIPTAENLAAHWFELLREELLLRGVAIYYVKVWETPSSTAQYGG